MGGKLSTSIRKQLINAFLEADGEFVSGQALADMIGCSRTAVWKEIEELRKEGFVLEAVRKKGYKIISSPDQLTESEILHGLTTNQMGRNVLYYETLQSTQITAHEAAQNGAAEGTLVIAEEQTGGRGRMARQWHSLKQKGIWMSLIIRPELPPERAPQFTLITAIAVVQAIEEITRLSPEIKWPNDILLNGKKLTGILTELQGEADKINYLVIGVGMNVNHTEADFPPEVKEIATSLAIEKGGQIERKELIQSFLKYFEKYYQLYIEKGFAPLKLIWEGYAASIGKKIIARTISGEITGRAIGISDEGILKIEDQEGKIHNIYSADIEIKS